MKTHKTGTLNERLVLNMKLRKFEEVIKNENRAELLCILKSVGLVNPDIDFIIENTKLDKRSLIKRILGI